MAAVDSLPYYGFRQHIGAADSCSGVGCGPSGSTDIVPSMNELDEEDNSNCYEYVDTDDELVFPSRTLRPIVPTGLIACPSFTPCMMISLPPASGALAWCPGTAVGTAFVPVALPLPSQSAPTGASWSPCEVQVQAVGQSFPVRNLPPPVPDVRQISQFRYTPLDDLRERLLDREHQHDFDDLLRRDHDFGDFDRMDSESDSGHSDSGTDVTLSDTTSEFDESEGDLSVDCPDAVCAEGCVVFCSICLDDCTSGQRLRTVAVCGHQFHAECLERWLQRRGRCPNCRRSVCGHVFE